MGDTGALTLGVLISILSLRINQFNDGVQVNNAFVMAFAPLIVPCFDVIRVYIHRIRTGKSPFLPDKNHIHHLLLRTGLNHLQTTGVLLSVSLLFIGLAILGRNWNIWLLLFADFALATILTLILWRVLNKKLYGQNADN